MRCCGNCEWSISPIDEEQIMEEQGYDFDDENRPKAGDCCIGMLHDKNYVCREHEYKEGMLDTEVLYDDSYMGPGILIVTRCDEDLVKFMKIVTMGNSKFPVFRIRAYEQKDYGIDYEEKIMSVYFSASIGDELYDAFYYLATNLDGKRIKTILPVYELKNNLETRVFGREASIILNQDTCGGRVTKDYVELTIGDNLTCNDYEYFFKFYNMLNDLVVRKATKEDVQRLVLKK